MVADRYIAIWPGGAFVTGPYSASNGGAPATVQLHIREGQLLPQGVGPEVIARLLRENLIRKATRWDGVTLGSEQESGDE
jgi:hypothetical protein